MPSFLLVIWAMLTVSALGSGGRKMNIQKTKTSLLVIVAMACLAAFSASGFAATPSTVTNLKAVPGTAQNTVLLTWLAPSDDGTTVPLSAGSSYYIQCSTNPGGPWSYNFAQVIISTSGVTPGTTVQCIFPNIAPSDIDLYYFSLWTQNGPGSGSSFSGPVISTVSVPRTVSLLSGAWSNPASWYLTGTLPWPNQIVNVATGQNVLFDVNYSSPMCAGMFIYGTLRFDSGISTRSLVVNGFIDIQNGGSLLIPANTGYISTIKIQSDSDGQHGLRMFQGGTINIQGTPKNCYARTTAASGASSVVVDNVSGFAIGDQVVVGTTQLATNTEKRTISNIVSNTLTFSTALSYSHAEGAEVLNLSRNTVITSAGAGRSYINLQMFSNSIDSCTFSYAELSNLGQYSTLYKDSLCLQGPARVSNCSIYDGGYNGISLYGSVGCRISNNAIYNVASYGIQAWGGSNNVINGNHISKAQSMGIYLTTNSQGNIISENTSFSNAYDGVRIESSCSALVYGNRFYSNSQFGGFSAGSGSAYLCNAFDGNSRGLQTYGKNDISDCVFGAKAVNTVDIGAALGGEALVYNSSFHSPTAVDPNLPNDSSVLSLNHNRVAGAAALWGVTHVRAGDIAILNYADNLSTAAASAVSAAISGSGSLSSITVSNTLTETELWRVTFNGSMYEVAHSSVPGQWISEGNFAGPVINSAARGVSFVMSNTGLKDGDAFYFGTIAACRAQNTDKTLTIGQNTASGGSSGIDVQSGGQFYVKGAPGHETTITSDGLSYYSFASSGVVGMSNFSFSRMDYKGLSFHPVSTILELSTGTFNNIQSTGAYLSFNGLNVSATYYALNFLDSSASAQYAVKANGPGVNVTFFNANGPKYGSSLVSGGALIQWYIIPSTPTSVQVIGVSSNTISLQWDTNGNPTAGMQYQVWYSTVAEFNPFYGMVVSASANAATLPNLFNYTTYYIHVEAYGFGSGVYSGYEVEVVTRTLSAYIAPQSNVALPVNNSFYSSLPLITGMAATTAQDSVVSITQIQLFDQITTQYWNGSVWQAGSAWVSTSFSDPDWSIATPSLTAAHKYTVTSRATDSRGRLQSVLSPVSFVYDITAPLSGVTYPLNGQHYSSIANISGTAADPGAPLYGSGVSQVSVALRRVSDNNYWNGSAWQPGLDWNSSGEGVTMTSSVTWTYTDSVLSSLTSGYYYVNTVAYDVAVAPNVAVSLSTSTFYIMGPATKLVVVAPGQVFANATGKTGTASAQTAGVPYTVTVKAVDDNDYADLASTATVAISTDDDFDTEPLSRPLVGGSTSFVITAKTAKTVVVTASADSIMSGTESVVVNAGAPAKFLSIVPGQAFVPGSATGKGGTPSAQVAGSPFTVTVQASDAYWNVVTGTAPGAFPICSDIYGVMPSSITFVAGVATFSMTLKQAATSSITVPLNAPYAAYVSSGIVVNAAAPAKIVVCSPGENFTPGSGAGKSGVPSAQVTGTPFTITIRATDAYGNIIYGDSSAISINTSDPDDTEPVSGPLSNGQGTAQATFVTTSSSWTITVDDIGALEAGLSSPIAAQDGTPPAAVTNLAAQVGAADGGISLAWSTPGDNGWLGSMQSGSKYYIQYALTPGVLWSTASAQIVVSTMSVPAGMGGLTQVTGLIGWTTYYFRLWYEDHFGNTAALSNQTSAYARDLMGPTMPALMSPSSGTYTNNTSNLQLNVNPCTDSGSGVAGYQIYVSSSMDFGVAYTWADVVSPLMSAALPQGVWHWRALAYDKAGNLSTYSNAWVVNVDTTAPSTPVNVTPSSGAVNIPSIKTFVCTNSTDNLSGVEYYEAQVSGNQDFSALFADLTKTSPNNSVLITGMGDGITWWRVRSFDKAGNISYWSVPTSFTVLGSIPLAPENFTGSVLSTSSILWTWSDVAYETEYRMFDSADVRVATLDMDATFYLETGLAGNTKAYRYLRAYNNPNGSSGPTDPLNRYTLANPPTDLVVAQAQAYNITLSWVPGAGGNTRYFVERSSNGVTYATRSEWADQLTAATFIDSGLTSNTTYFYRVAGYNGDGIITAKTAALVAVSAYVPPSVISGKVTQSKGTGITGVEIKAEKSGSIVSYTVYTSTEGAYTVALEQAIADGLYKVHATWIANGISASVYKDSIANGTDAVNFILETNYELGTITGQVSIASGAPRRLAPGSNDPISPAFVELMQNGKPIATIPTKLDGSYEIPNLMPGVYSVRSFNGVAYSRASQVNLKEGQQLALSFTYDLLQQDKVYCYPNPAVSKDLATVHFETSGQDIEVMVNIYTISGELVISAPQSQITILANVCEYNWNLRNSAGSPVASGVYLVQVKVKDKNTGETSNATKKLAVIR
jgi:parallel beta-helix repeat protein